MSKEYAIGVIEGRFAEIIWNSAPVSTTDLIIIASSEFGWKRTTTYTVLKRLCNRGMFELNSGVVTVIIQKEDFYAQQAKEYIVENYGGSLPKFLAAFTATNKLKNEEIEEINRIIRSGE